MSGRQSLDMLEDAQKNRDSSPPVQAPLALEYGAGPTDTDSGRKNAAVKPSQSVKDWKDELKQLKELLDSGILTQDEFNTQKAKIIQSS